MSNSGLVRALPPSRLRAAIMKVLVTAAATILLACAGPAAALELHGHRGARGLMPENTLPAFASALSLGVDVLEFDTGVTRDGVVVVAHDPELNPDLTRVGTGLYLAAPGPTLHSLTLDELRRFDVGRLKPETRYGQQFTTQRPVDGARIPTLAEVFALAKRAGNERVRFNIETKLNPERPELTLAPEAFVDALRAAVASAGMTDRVIIQSFDWRTLKRAQAKMPAVPTACLTIEQKSFDNVRRGAAGPSPWTAGLDIDDFAGSVPRLVRAAGCRIWSPLFRELSAETLAEARAFGLAVVTWTVNEPGDMARLIELGVDGIITDYPDRLRQVMADRGLPLPPPTPVEP